MRALRIIRSGELREGRWRNGLGVSWDIASEPAHSGMDDFGWRFAIARIEADVPFSDYPGVDRIFTLIEGPGLELHFGDGHKLHVGHPFVPHPFACDVPAYCTLANGACRALNLFTRRGAWQASAQILSSNAEIANPGPVLLFALTGGVEANGESLETHDAAVVGSGAVSVIVNAGLLYAARLARL